MTRDVHLDALRAAHPLETPFLQHAQQLGLHRRRDVADLVEEQRAAVGLLETALALADGPGERAFLVAEQLTFQKGFREGGAVDGHELAGTERGRGVVDGAGDLLLAGPGLALDQHRRGGLGDAPDQLKDGVHLRVGAEDVAEAVLFMEPFAKLNDLVL